MGRFEFALWTVACCLLSAPWPQVVLGTDATTAGIVVAIYNTTDCPAVDLVYFLVVDEDHECVQEGPVFISATESDGMITTELCINNETVGCDCDSPIVLQGSYGDCSNIPLTSRSGAAWPFEATSWIISFYSDDQCVTPLPGVNSKAYEAHACGAAPEGLNEYVGDGAAYYIDGGLLATSGGGNTKVAVSIQNASCYENDPDVGLTLIEEESACFAVAPLLYATVGPFEFESSGSGSSGSPPGDGSSSPPSSSSSSGSSSSFGVRLSDVLFLVIVTVAAAASFSQLQMHF